MKGWRFVWHSELRTFEKEGKSSAISRSFNLANCSPADDLWVPGFYSLNGFANISQFLHKNLFEWRIIRPKLGEHRAFIVA